MSHNKFSKVRKNLHIWYSKFKFPIKNRSISVCVTHFKLYLIYLQKKYYENHNINAVFIVTHCLFDDI